MIQSMTGYGRAESITPELKIAVEIRSVNHRYCDLSIRLPRRLTFLEAAVRTLLKEYMTRGKIDVLISYEEYQDCGVKVVYHPEVAGAYLSAVAQMCESFSLENDMKASALAGFSDVFTVEEESVNEEAVWAKLSPVIREAAEHFVQTRQREGDRLKEDLLKKCGILEACVDFIESRAPLVVDTYRERLLSKVQELLGDRQIEESLLVTELTLYADKICVDEETVRLRSHIAHMRETLEQGESIGRKLDFIAQEMNREANTILSKASDQAITQQAITCKTEIEKIREQIQNIE